jgi:hypothetical protein
MVVGGSTETGVDEVVAGVSSAVGDEPQATTPTTMPSMHITATARRPTAEL